MGSSIGAVSNCVDVEKFLRDLEDFDPSRRTRMIDVMNKDLDVYQLKHYKFKGKNLNEVITNYCLKSFEENKEIKEKMRKDHINDIVIASELEKSIGLYLIGYEQLYGEAMPSILNYKEHGKLKARLKEWIGDKTVYEVQNVILQRLTLYPFDEHVKIIVG